MNKLSASMTRQYQWFWQVFTPYWRVYRDVFLASLLVNLFAVVSPLFVMNVYDRVVPNQAFETLWFFTVGVLLAYSFEFILRLLRARYIDLAGRQIDMTLSSRLIDRLLGLKLASRPGQAGTLMNSLSEFESIRSFITSTTVMAFIDLPFVVLFLALITWVGGWMVVIPMVCITLSLTVAWLLNHPVQNAISYQQQMSSKRQNFLMELLLGLVSVKACNVERQHQQTWSQLNGEVAETGLKIRRLQSLSSQSATLFLQLNTVFLVVAGVHQITAGELSMGGLIAITMIAGRCGAPVAQVIGLLNQYDRTLNALEHAEQLINLPQEQPEDRQFLAPEVFQGHWQLHNVLFSYPGMPAQIKNISLEITPGEKVAILGHMGSGKSTLLQLLMGFQEPLEGHICIGNIDMRQLSPDWIRRNTGYVPQSVELFSGTLRDNIVMRRSGINDDDVLRALEQAGLGSIVQSGSKGLDYPVGEGGRNLSGGQAQAVGLARALVTRPKALILDEPTNAMDSQGESRFKRLLQELKDTTVIVVTHKMSLLDAMDRIVILEQGQIRVSGTTEDLLSYQKKPATVPQSSAYEVA